MRRRDFVAAGVAGTVAPLNIGSAKAQSPTLKNLRVCFQIPETGFDPAQTQDYYSNTIISHLFDAPLRYDFLARPVRLVPNTAAALPEVSSDFRTFTVRLTPGIFFQDDAAFKGRRRELIAADYVYSIKRVFDPRWKSQVLFVLEPARIIGLEQIRQRALKGNQPFDYRRDVEGLQVLDRYTFQVRLERPNPRFVNLLALANPLGAVAHEVVEAYGDQIMAHPVGTGPFRLAQWTRTSRIVLERNPTYREEIYGFTAPENSPRLAADVERLRGRHVPLVDRVEVSIIQEAQPRLLSFEQGRTRSPAGADRVRRAGRAESKAGAESRASRCAARRDADGGSRDDLFQYGGSALSAATRRSASHCDARSAWASITRTTFARFSKATAWLRNRRSCPGTFGYDPQWRTGMSEYNPAQAKALLDTYGYIDRNSDGWREQPDGSPLILEKAASPSEIDRRQSEQWRRYMTAIGLKMEFHVAQWPELVKRSLAGTLMIWNFAWQAQEPDSDLFFSLAYGPNKGSANDARFSLKAYDELYERQRELPNGPERLAAMHEATRLLVAYMPYKFHLHRIQQDLAQPWLLGYRRHPFTTRAWAYLDVDNGAHERPQA